MIVEIVAPARLHFGFYNILSSRFYGSIGLAINSPRYRLRLRRFTGVKVVNGHVRVESYAKMLVNKLNVEGVYVEVYEEIPQHVGLGSTTQLLLSLATGIDRLYGLGLKFEDIVRICGRGRISGIGIEAFRRGGFIVDTGHIFLCEKPIDIPKPLIRIPFPTNWGIVIVIPKNVRGFSEEEEFKYLIPEEPPLKVKYDLLKNTFLDMIPSIIEKDYESFSKALTRLQIAVGTYFSRYQHGIYCCKETEEAVKNLLKLGAKGVGQSSWGPTAYGIFKTIGEAKKAVKELKHTLTPRKYHIRLVKGRNIGAKIKVYQSTS